MIFEINKDIKTLPLLDKTLIHINPNRILSNIENNLELIDQISVDLRPSIFLGNFANVNACYPRFDLDTFLWKINPYISSSNLNEILKTNFYNFAFITDNRSFDLLKYSKNFNNINIFWSGGIDSTLIVSAIIKNWSKQDLSKITILLDESSIKENLYFYERFIITNFKFKEFTKFNECDLYITGDGGGAISLHSGIIDFNNKFPNYFNKSWKKHKSIIINYFFKNSKNIKDSISCFNLVADNIDKHNINPKTIEEFFFWINFNWHINDDLCYFLWCYGELSHINNIKNFYDNNFFKWFNTLEYQSWGINSLGTDIKLKNNIKNFKYPFKKYIFELDKNLDYFENKSKEKSIPKMKYFQQSNKLLLAAIDEEFNLYYVREKNQ